MPNRRHQQMRVEALILNVKSIEVDDFVICFHSNNPQATTSLRSYLEIHIIVCPMHCIAALDRI